MKRNCYLVLRFHPSSGYSPRHNSKNELLSINKQVVAVLHNKRHMFDITELQARVIIWLASQEMEEKDASMGPAPTPSLLLQPKALLVHAPNGISIKRSLRNFLQRRKKRSQSHIAIATHSSTN
ncbi:protein JAZ13 [Gastrolobium bilobum]|uniref:protein JAZ13 n=1 Tax=Gastrolobium bilobum TaxID=150636 RepID=UPI002AB0E647|nr:protein JAZ13 [Gastrolobium bilobum]